MTVQFTQTGRPESLLFTTTKSKTEHKQQQRADQKAGAGNTQKTKLYKHLFFP